MPTLKSKFMDAKPTGEVLEDRQVFTVTNRKAGSPLGMIGWFAPWKRFVFSPAHKGCVFSADCLTALAAFCKELGEKS